VRRLNKVLYLIDAIPRKIAELRNKPLDLTQYEIAIEMIASCLPKIVGVEEWIANPRKFLDILGTGPCTFPCTLPCHGAVVVLAKCAAVVEMMVPSTWTGVVDTASSEWTGVVRAVWLMMMTIMRPMMKHSRYGTQRRVSSFS
jgi:predicted RNA methylase